MNLEIKKFLEDRNITTLCHFTKVSNLNSILAHGLLSIDTLKNKGVNYSNNDEYRLDNETGAICTSITFPNYRMFYRYRSNSNEEWCVLKLDARLLYEKNCLFCVTNAASNEETTRNRVNKVGVNGLKKLFYDDEYMRSVGLGRDYTTDPQAEILVLDNIEVEYIQSVNFNTSETEFQIGKFPRMKFWQNTSLFTPRSDYDNWR